jgi:hypothetical protein
MGYMLWVAGQESSTSWMFEFGRGTYKVVASHGSYGQWPILVAILKLWNIILSSSFDLCSLNVS